MSTIDLQERLFDAERLDQLRIGRSELLKKLGAGLFGIAGLLIMPASARAGHRTVCHGLPPCSCCVWGPGCCHNECHVCDCGCQAGTYCWYTCYHGEAWKCCDFMYPDPPTNYCICKHWLGPSCSGCDWECSQNPQN